MLGRLKRILQAAVEDLVDKARDPELELARFVEEVELSLGEVRGERTEADLRCARLATRSAEHRAAADEWMSKAEEAAARDEDDLAREALRRHYEAREEAQSCQERLVEAQLSLTTLRKDEAEL